MSALVTIKNGLPKLAQSIEVLHLESDADLEFAAGVLRHVKTLINSLEDERKARVKPIKDQASAIDQTYREPRRALEGVERQLKQRIGEAHLAIAAARTAALADASEAATQGDVEGATKALARAGAPAAATPGVSVRFRWAAIVRDANAIPRAYLTPDLVKIHALSSGQDKPPEIPGIEWAREPIVAARGVR